MGATPAENERRMREYIRAWNDHDVEAILTFFADDYLRDVGEAEAIFICETWFDAFPDLTHEITELVADGDWVLGRLILHGTHEGPYKGIPATGNEIEVADHFSTRFVDGEIVAHHALADDYTLLRQLGVSLPPERTREAENKAIVRRYFDALNDRDKAAFRETLAKDFTYGDIQSREEHVENDWKWLEALELTWEVQSMHAGGGFVTTRVKATGTHRGEILGIEPTGESFDVTAMTLSRIKDGNIAEWWSEWDLAGFLDQIGAIDAPVYDD